MALVRGEPALLAQHRQRVAIRADRDPVTAGMLPLGGKPVARLKPPVLDRCFQVVSDLLVGGPWVTGVRHWHCTSLRCARPPGRERRQRPLTDLDVYDALCFKSKCSSALAHAGAELAV